MHQGSSKSIHLESLVLVHIILEAIPNRIYMNGNARSHTDSNISTHTSHRVLLLVHMYEVIMCHLCLNTISWKGQMWQSDCFTPFRRRSFLT